MTTLIMVPWKENVAVIKFWVSVTEGTVNDVLQDIVGGFLSLWW